LRAGGLNVSELIKVILPKQFAQKVQDLLKDRPPVLHKDITYSAELSRVYVVMILLSSILDAICIMRNNIVGLIKGNLEKNINFFGGS